MHHSYTETKNAASTARNQAGLAVQKASTPYEKNMAEAVHFLAKAVEGLIELQGSEAEARARSQE